MSCSTRSRRSFALVAFAVGEYSPGALGIAASKAASSIGKQAKDLTIDEAALLAAIPKAPGEYSPTANATKAKERRDLVLQLMANNGFASQSDVDAAKAKPIVLSDSAYYQSP